MPQTVKVEEVPTFSRSTGPGKYDEICNFLTALITDEKRRTTEGLLFNAEDGVIVADSPDGTVKNNLAQVLQVLRLAAKQAGSRVALVIKPEGVYAKFNGAYIEMTEAQKEARKVAREANASVKAMQANTAAKAAAKAGK
jgi:hypothetical protein